MKVTFIKNFEGTCTRPATVEELRRCVQKEGESTRRWLQQWADIWNSSLAINFDETIPIFWENCKFEPLVQKLMRSKEGR